MTSTSEEFSRSDRFSSDNDVRNRSTLPVPRGLLRSLSCVYRRPRSDADMEFGPTMAQPNIMHTSHLRGKHAPGRISLVGASVLLVEDEPLIALDLHAALSAAGAGIIAATESAEALRLIRRNDISAA